MSVSQFASDSIQNYLKSEIDLSVQNSFSIFVTNELSEEMVSVDTYPKSTVYEIKSLFQQNEGISPEHLELYFNEEKLQNERTLEDYGIKGEDVLVSYLALDGGKPGGSCNCGAGCKPKWSNRCCCWQCSCDCSIQ